MDTLLLTRTWDEEAVTAAVEKTLSGVEVSLAVVRYHLRKAVEDEHRASQEPIDYAGPRIRCSTAREYMSLCTFCGEVTRG